MRIVNAGLNDWTIEQKLILQSYGISVEEGPGQVEFEVNDENREVLELLKDWDVELTVGTIFEKEDFSKSPLFVYAGAWENGYPMPDNDGGYRSLTYTLDDYCKVCGTGMMQKSPFRIKKEPNWGSKMLFELTWIHDEIFVKKELYDRVFKKAGLDCWPVLVYKKDTPIVSTVQLKIPKVITPLVLKDHPYEVCTTCGRKKYRPQPEGFFSGFTKPITGGSVFKCSEYFGIGGEAHNKIFMNRKVWEELQSLKIKLNVWPVEP